MKKNTETDILKMFPMEIWMEFFSYLPKESHLPICHVSKLFREIWMTTNINDDNNNGKDERKMEKTVTNPMILIFQCPWKHNMSPRPNCLSTSLLQYFVDNGWMGIQKKKEENHNLSTRYFDRLFRGTVSRGDIPGIRFLLHNNNNLLSKELCTLASASGQLETLRWLREEMDCPFDPVEMYQEAAENLHHHIMDYIEYIDDTQSYESRMSYGVGMPYQ